MQQLLPDVSFFSSHNYLQNIYQVFFNFLFFNLGGTSTWVIEPAMVFRTVAVVGTKIDFPIHKHAQPHALPLYIFILLSLDFRWWIITILIEKFNVVSTFFFYLPFVLLVGISTTCTHVVIYFRTCDLKDYIIFSSSRMRMWPGQATANVLFMQTS